MALLSLAPVSLKICLIVVAVALILFGLGILLILLLLFSAENTPDKIIAGSHGHN